jgi:hypothetical protein
MPVVVVEASLTGVVCSLVYSSGKTNNDSFFFFPSKDLGHTARSKKGIAVADVGIFRNGCDTATS